MEVNTMARIGTAMEQTRAAQEVSVAVLKKALDAQSNAAVALLEALPPSASSNLPLHLGQNINTKA
jgi:hypothetical protein